MGTEDLAVAEPAFDADNPWDARLAALERIFGRSGSMLYHAVVPMFLGGGADVITFCESHVPGVVYVTADLTPEWSAASVHPAYELVVVTRRPEPWAGPLLSRLGQYIAGGADLLPGETMDTGDFLGGPDSPLRAMIMTEAPARERPFEFAGQTFGLHLCVGITAAELAHRMEHGAESLLKLLRAGGVVPYTDTERGSVL